MNPAEKLQHHMNQTELTLGVAESCTGGGLASKITEVPGSSAYFLGGVIAYHNSVKNQLLDVPRSTLATEGAVSEEAALYMAEGTLQLLNVDLALSVTGIAGPEGGTSEKPVGLAYIGLAAYNGDRQCIRKVWDGSRKENRKDSVQAALSLAIGYLENRLTN